MKPTQDKFPFFEANQVLSNAHLNQAVNYLDEQARLTRANLIGIGIVCGLDVKLDSNAAPNTIHLSKGCGITSEGYLIVEPENIALVAYRDYKAPDNLAYQPFIQESNQYALWELFSVGEPNTTNLDANFLKGKAVLLFLELKKEGLRNCSPNNCDDKGAAVTATVRRLLISVDDLTAIIKTAHQLPVSSALTDLNPTDIEAVLLERLNLPDLRLPRYDVPNTHPVTSNQVLAGFYSAIHGNQLVQDVNSALTAAYEAFKPLVQDKYPVNPFTGLITKFGFLIDQPTTTAQVSFLQYYYDFFDDLLRAYDEFRWKGVALLCACCPSEGLFPRHLMLGELFPTASTNLSIYRNEFLASSAITGCEERTQELLQLFQRLVAMISHFSEIPPLPKPAPNIRVIDNQVRITPSLYGDVPLSAKAIPYYYQQDLQDGTPPLYQLWSAEKTRWNQSRLILGYRSDEYTPTPPKFVIEPLRYDLEPYNFFRIEGQIGKDFRSVMRQLLTLTSQYRLPFDLVALRAGAFDDAMTVDLSKESCRFQDLETHYDTLKSELTSFLVKEIQYFYDLPVELNPSFPTPPPGGSGTGVGTSTTTVQTNSAQKVVSTGPDIAIILPKPKLPLLVQFSPEFLLKVNTIGFYFETNLRDSPDLSVTLSMALSQSNQIIVNIIIGISELFAQLSQDLAGLDFKLLEQSHRSLANQTKAFEIERTTTNSTITGSAALLTWEELDDRLEAIINSSRLDAFRVLQEEFKRRIKEAKQSQFLGNFLQKHPSIQHKGGVPVGGTFILVYHENAKSPDTNSDNPIIDVFPGTTTTNLPASTQLLANALSRIQNKSALLTDDINLTEDIKFVLTELPMQFPILSFPDILAGLAVNAEKIIAETVNGFADGTIIADFFLPYRCCSDCTPVQFVLPKIPPSFKVELVSDNSIVSLRVMPEGGMPPYRYELESQSGQPTARIAVANTLATKFSPFEGELKGDFKLTFPVGLYTLVITDSEGLKSAPQTITIPAALLIGQETYIDDVSTLKYKVSFEISGGTPPYSIESGTIKDNNIFTSKPIESGKPLKVTISDSNKFNLSKEFPIHTVCTLPSAGVSRRSAYRLWLQPPVKEFPYKSYKQNSAVKFKFNDKEIELSESGNLLQISLEDLNDSDKFQTAMGILVENLNSQINTALIKVLPTAGDKRLVINYKPSPSDPFGILWIESFAEDTFNIEFDFDYSIASQDPKTDLSFNLTWRFSKETATLFNGTVLINGNDKMETRVPAFDGSERNQCSNSDYFKLCTQPPFKPTFSITVVENTQSQLLGNDNGVADIIAWVWEVITPDSTQPFYQGKTVLLPLIKRGTKVQVKLTAITQNGCFGTSA